MRSEKPFNASTIRSVAGLISTLAPRPIRSRKPPETVTRAAARRGDEGVRPRELDKSVAILKSAPVALSNALDRYSGGHGTLALVPQSMLQARSLRLGSLATASHPALLEHVEKSHCSSLGAGLRPEDPAARNRSSVAQGALAAGPRIGPRCPDVAPKAQHEIAGSEHCRCQTKTLGRKFGVRHVLMARTHAPPPRLLSRAARRNRHPFAGSQLRA